MSRAEAISGFLKRLGRGHRFARLGLALTGQGLVLAVALMLLDLVRHGWVGIGMLVCGAWLVLVAVWIWFRSHVPLPDADRQLGLQDRLQTWVGLPPGQRRLPMAALLEADLDQRLRRMDPRRCRGMFQRPLGALRYLLPVLLLLLLLRNFAPLVPPTRPDGQRPVPRGGGGGQDGPGKGPPPRQGEGPPDRPRPAPQQTPPKPPPDKHEARGHLPPRPLISGPRPRDEPLLPAFVHDAPSRKALVRRAVLEQGPDKTGGAGHGAGPARSKTPLEQRKLFQKAYEAALRARHVPPEERTFVRSYFEALIHSRH